MRYLPLTPEEKEKILKTCGVSSLEDILEQIPDNLRLKKLLDLKDPCPEPTLKKIFKEFAKENLAASMTSFLGQGTYQHDWPVVIDQIVNRGEFMTAYTPYQPEVSQGTLQSIFEFQSVISELFKMPVANASLYDGSTAVVEAVLMACRIDGGKTQGLKVLVSEGIYPETKKILETYLEPLGIEMETWWTDPEAFRHEELPIFSEPTRYAAVVLQSPNRWGLIEDWNLLSQTAQKYSALSIAHVSHPYSLALFPTPGEAQLDIVTGEGQALGIPPGFGGPYLGLFTTKKEYVRQMPGRLVGATVDAQGKRAFCVTLSTREQHIRREKATSNICSNQNLMALRALIFLSLMGPRGLYEKAKICRSKAYYLRERLKEKLAIKHPTLKILGGEIFNEVSVLIPQKEVLWVDQALSRAEKEKILAGLKISTPASSGFVSALNIAVTELHSKKQLDQLVEVLSNEEGQVS